MVMGHLCLVDPREDRSIRRISEVIDALLNVLLDLFCECKSISFRSMSLKADFRKDGVSHAHRKVHMRPI